MLCGTTLSLSFPCRRLFACRWWLAACLAACLPKETLRKSFAAFDLSGQGLIGASSLADVLLAADIPVDPDEVPHSHGSTTVGEGGRAHREEVNGRATYYCVQYHTDRV